MAQGWRGSYYRYKDFFLNILELYKKRADLRMFLEIILSLTTVIIFTVFALKPTIVTIVELIKEINNKKETITNLDKKIGDLEQAQVVYSQNLSSLPAIYYSVPDMPSPDVFSTQIEAIADINSIKILGLSIGEVSLIGFEDRRITPSELKPFPQGAQELTVSISATGSYQDIMSFIKNLENSRRPIKMDILGISTTQNDLEQVISVIITGRTAFLGIE